jgi:hypothetical protein
VGLLSSTLSYQRSPMGSSKLKIELWNMSGGLSGKQLMMCQTTRVLDSQVAPVRLWKQFRVSGTIT